MKQEVLNDKIYGPITVTSPVLIDLINSAPVQRTKRINQYGIPDEYYHKKNFSRYDHCVGVMLLLKHLGASEEEQAAGLLHDVSHMAFSHVYDWVREDHTQKGPKRESTQDDGHYEFVQHSEIPKILSKYGLNTDRVTNHHHYSLLERDSPALCADRVDYSLRELPIEQAVEIFRGLVDFEGQIVCKDEETAALFGRVYLGLQRNHWGGYEAVARYTYFSSALLKAIELGVISEGDFKEDDAFIMEKLKVTPDLRIRQILQVLRKPLEPSNYGKVYYKKFRYIDPPILNHSRLHLLTEVDPEYRKLLQEAKRENEKGVIVTPL